MALTFSGPAQAVIFGQPVDLSRQRNGDMVLAFSARLDAAPTGPVELGFGQDRIDIAPLLAQVRVGEWRQIRVRLACFDAARADVAAVETPFVVSSTPPLALSLADNGGDLSRQAVIAEPVVCPDFRIGRLNSFA